MSERVLITGANSLLGVNTIHEFLDAGYTVRGLLRKRASYIGREDRKLELIEGDFTDAGTLHRVMQGCDFVVHCAAQTGQNCSYNSYYRINIAATEQLIRVAISCGIKRIVYVVSANTFAYGDIDSPGTESHQICVPFTFSSYAKSKYEAQTVISRYFAKIDIVTVSPTFMLGAYDSRPSSGRIVLMGFGHRIVFYPPGGKNFVHVGDVARGIIAALQRGGNGECYLLANENLTYREFFIRLNSHNKTKPMLVPIPKFMLLLAGAFGDCLRWFGWHSELSVTNMRILCIRNYYSNAKSIKELGLTYRPVMQAIDDAIDWFKL